MPTELYKKHRPRALRAVVGNSDTVTALQGMLEAGTLPHAILFYGPAGCGKTTLARIVQKELGCHPMDLRELNSSSYRGIDSIREIAQAMNLAPAGKCRVWILDEVHQLTNDAQNAALKMLEDTPAHVYFLLCTTDPQKLIRPLRSRCTELPVRPLSDDEMASLVRRVCKREGISLSDEHLELLVDSSQGAPRDALVLLDRIRHVPESERESVITAAIPEEQSQAIDLCRALIAGDPWKKIAAILKGLESADVERVRWAVMGYAKSVLLSAGRNHHHAYVVIDAFCRPFYDSKFAGLVAACYEVACLSER